MDISQARSENDIFTYHRPTTLINWETNHLLARIFFHSNTQEMTKKQMCPSDFPVLCQYMKKSGLQLLLQYRRLPVLLKFLMQENDVTSSNVMEMKISVTKLIKMTSCKSMQ